MPDELDDDEEDELELDDEEEDDELDELDDELLEDELEDGSLSPPQADKNMANTTALAIRQRLWKQVKIGRIRTPQRNSVFLNRRGDRTADAVR